MIKSVKLLDECVEITYSPKLLISFSADMILSYTETLELGTYIFDYKSNFHEWICKPKLKDIHEIIDDHLAKNKALINIEYQAFYTQETITFKDNYNRTFLIPAYFAITIPDETNRLQKIYALTK